jgi:hypothetical protein
MASLIGGKFTISCDGVAYYASGVFKYGAGFDKREAVLHSGGVAGFKTSAVAPYISGELIDNDSLSISNIANMTDSTITLDLANGKQIVLRGAYCTNDNGLEVDTDGKITIKFEGQSLEEVPAQ